MGDSFQFLKGTGKVEDNKFTPLLYLFVQSFLSNSTILNLVQDPIVKLPAAISFSWIYLKHSEALYLN